MANLTLLDLITLQKNDPLTGLVEDVTTYAPEVSSIPVVVRPGITYYIAKRTALPTSGFRQVNQGIASSKSAYKKEVKDIYELAKQGQKEALLVWEEFSYALGMFLSGMVNIFGPQAVILGGGISGAFDLFKPMVLKTIKK